MPYGVYLKCDKFKGGCKAKGHEDAIELISVSHSMTLPTSFSQSREGGLSAGDPKHAPLTITYELCSASPKINEALNKGQHIDKLEIAFDKPGGDALNFFKITLEDVVVSRHDLVANSKGDDPSPVQVADLTYNKITHEHNTQDNKGGKAGTVGSSYSVTQVAAA
jgi:type VI secretion system secreted protein Hcp